MKHNGWECEEEQLVGLLQLLVWKAQDLEYCVISCVNLSDLGEAGDLNSLTNNFRLS